MLNARNRTRDSPYNYPLVTEGQAKEEKKTKDRSILVGISMHMR